jgi:hemoglobin
VTLTMSAQPGAAPGDLDRRAAIHDLVVHFYQEIAIDVVLAPVFQEVAEVDWSLHIPNLIDYWCRVLLGERGYSGSILATHRYVHDIEAFRIEHFDRWYELWVCSIDANWAGSLAEEAKRHAGRIAAFLARRLLDTPWSPATEPDEGDPGSTVSSSMI